MERFTKNTIENLTPVVNDLVYDFFKYLQENNTPLKYSILPLLWDQFIKDSVKTNDDSPKCDYILKRGLRKSEPCGVSIKSDNAYCPQHLNKKKLDSKVVDADINTIEEESVEELCISPDESEISDDSADDIVIPDVIEFDDTELEVVDDETDDVADDDDDEYDEIEF